MEQPAPAVRPSLAPLHGAVARAIAWSRRSREARSGILPLTILLGGSRSREARSMIFPPADAEGRSRMDGELACGHGLAGAECVALYCSDAADFEG